MYYRYSVALPCVIDYDVPTLIRRSAACSRRCTSRTHRVSDCSPQSGQRQHSQSSNTSQHRFTLTDRLKPVPLECQRHANESPFSCGFDAQLFGSDVLQGRERRGDTKAQYVPR